VGEVRTLAFPSVHKISPAALSVAIYDETGGDYIDK